MARLSRILVPVEFSPRCRGAVQYAEALACHFHSEIILLNVVLPPLANYTSFEAMAYASAIDLAQEIATQRTLDLAAFPCKSPVGVRSLVLVGDPSRTITDTAAAELCDLIVMPTHGYGPFRRFLLGSVTAKVLHDAICPVCTGPHMEQAPDPASISFHHVACAVDLGLHSREVIAWAAEFARDYGALLTILHAIPTGTARRDELASQASERIAALCAELNVKASVAVEPGAAPAVVASKVAALGASVLVIGRGSTSRAHGHLPVNAYTIVRESPCPVITI